MDASNGYRIMGRRKTAVLCMCLSQNCCAQSKRRSVDSCAPALGQLLSHHNRGGGVGMVPRACTAPPNLTVSNDPLIVRGKALYEANCQLCHGGATGGTMMDLPPKH